MFTRNLLFHIMPTGDGLWRKSTKQLLRRMNLFNGKKVIAILTDSGPLTIHVPPGGTVPDDIRTNCHHFEPPGAVIDLFKGHDCQFIITPNDPNLREVKTFHPLFRSIENTNPNEVLFYGHAKGATRPLGHVAHAWARALFEINLDYWPYIERILQEYPACGPFLRSIHGWAESYSDYHFAGSMWWMRCRDLFLKPDWHKIDRFWSGIESWPSLKFLRSQVHCLIHEFYKPGPGLYDWNYWLEEVEPDLKKFREERLQDYKEW